MANLLSIIPEGGEENGNEKTFFGPRGGGEWSFRGGGEIQHDHSLGTFTWFVHRKKSEGGHYSFLE